MKKPTVLLAALALLALLCGCEKRADKRAQSGITPAITAATSGGESADEQETEKYAIFEDGRIGDIPALHPAEATIGDPAPVEPTTEIKSADIPTQIS